MSALVDPADVAAALAEGRAAAEALMTDTVKVTRKSGTPVTDPVTGKVTYPETTVYPVDDQDGRGYVQMSNAAGFDSATPGGSVTVQESRVSVPHYVDLRIGDVIECLASPTEPLLPGRRFSVAKLLHKTRATAHRAAIEEIT